MAGGALLGKGYFGQFQVQAYLESEEDCPFRHWSPEHNELFILMEDDVKSCLLLCSLSLSNSILYLHWTCLPLDIKTLMPLAAETQTSVSQSFIGEQLSRSSSIEFPQKMLKCLKCLSDFLVPALAFCLSTPCPYDGYFLLLWKTLLHFRFKESSSSITGLSCFFQTAKATVYRQQQLQNGHRFSIPENNRVVACIDCVDSCALPCYFANLRE